MAKVKEQGCIYVGITNSLKLLVSKACRELQEMRLPVEFRYQIMELCLVLIHPQEWNSQKSERRLIQGQSSRWRNLQRKGRWWMLGIKWKSCHWDRTLHHLPSLGWKITSYRPLEGLLISPSAKKGSGHWDLETDVGRRSTLSETQLEESQHLPPRQLEACFPGEQVLHKHFPLKRIWNVNVIH